MHDVEPGTQRARTHRWRQPTVSVGVPVYNGEAFLAETLRSIQRQTFDDVEIVVCDNASTDATGEIALHFAQEDPRFRYVRNGRNLGVIRNWRRAFELTTGRYFKWLAADDLIDAKYLERCVAAIEHDPRTTLVACLMPAIDEHGERLPFDEASGAYVSASGEHYHVWSAPPSLADGDPAVRFHSVIHDLPGNMQGQFTYGLMRTDVLREIPPHGLYLGAERVLQAELALRGPWGFVDEELALRRIHDGHFGGGGARRAIEGINPERPNRFAFPAGRQLWGYHAAIRRSGLSKAQRRTAYASLAHKVVVADAWASIFLPGDDNYFGWGRSST